MPPGETAVTTCPGKLNLFLEVLGKRPDGYHDIETVMVPLRTWSDGLEVQRIPGGRIELEIRFSPGKADPSVPAGEGNLAVRAARRVLQEVGSDAGLRVVLWKVIPAGSGLGGGSSDAAGALRLVNRVLGDPVPESRLHEIALELGSDVPFFLRGEPAIARGRGEVLESIPCKPGLWYAVWYPGFPISTRDVYSRCRVPLPRERMRPDAVLRALAEGDREALSLACFNRLKEAAREVSPDLDDAFDRFSSFGAGFPVHLSGSGSACFVVVPPRKLGEEEDPLAQMQLGFRCRSELRLNPEWSRLSDGMMGD